VVFADSSNLIAETYYLIEIENIWVTVVAGTFAIFVRDKPLHAPSLVATKDDPEKKMLKIFEVGFKNKSYVLLVCIFGCIDGAFASFSSIMSFLFSFYNVPGQPKMYPNSLVSLYGACVSIVGVLSSLIVGAILQKT
jgi:Na+/melibiose symporter-like transporter